MKKLAMAASFLLISCAALSQQAQWKHYFFPGDEFSISLPANPNPHNDNGDAHINVYSVRMGTTVFTLRVVTRAMDCETGLAEMWDHAEKNANPKEPVIKGTLKEVSLAGMRGLEYETDLGNGERSLHRFHCADSRKFYIFNAGFRGSKRPPEVMKIINSFQLVNPAQQ